MLDDAPRVPPQTCVNHMVKPHTALSLCGAGGGSPTAFLSPMAAEVPGRSFPAFSSGPVAFCAPRRIGWPFGNIGWRDTASYVLMGGMAVWLICRFAGDR